MNWNRSRCIAHAWPNGFHLNITEADLTPAAAPYRVHPASPTNVWAGDPGVPQMLKHYAEDGTSTSVANPEWTPGSPGFSTVFLKFASEAEARAVLPHLWIAE